MPVSIDESPGKRRRLLHGAVLSSAVSQRRQSPSVLRSRAALAIVHGLRQLGYRDSLLQENYALADWFEQKQERRLVAAAFGETPASYDSACIGVIAANGIREHALVNGFRSLGAPILLEALLKQVWVDAGRTERPSLRSERVHLAHAQPRPSTRFAGPPLRCGPPGDCRD